jgi:hypothetical protein
MANFSFVVKDERWNEYRGTMTAWDEDEAATALKGRFPCLLKLEEIPEETRDPAAASWNAFVFLTAAVAARWGLPGR